MRQSWLALLGAIPILAQCSVAQENIRVAFPNLRFVSPVDLRQSPVDSNRLFVVEQRGVIRSFDRSDRSTNQAPVFMNITPRVRSGGELGLLGLAFDPAFRENQYFYLYYTADNPLRVIISRFSIDPADPTKGDSSSEAVVLVIPQPFENHNGGSIAFGPDGYLYIGVGDGGSGGDPGDRAQDRDSLLGKILRIDVHPPDTSLLPYAIPPDNPFASGGGRPEIFAWGVRNPWRFSFDPVTGKLWCGDVGQEQWEEIDIIENGRNYGWRVMEGFHCYWPQQCDSTGLTSPLIDYPHESGVGSVTGGVVNRAEPGSAGDNGPIQYGEYVYADFVFGRIWALTLDSNGVVHSRVVDSTRLNPSVFGTDSDGHIYFCAYDGRIFEFGAASDVDRGKGEVASALLRPNPIRDHAELVLHMRDAATIRVEVVDIAGGLVRSFPIGLLEAGSRTVPLDMGSLPSGTYRWIMTTDREERISGPLSIVR